jgi:hypothetical protein
LFLLWVLQALELFVNPIFFFFFKSKSTSHYHQCVCRPACMHA